MFCFGQTNLIIDFCSMPTDSTIAFKMYCSFSNLTECGMSRCSSGGGGWQWVTHAAGGPTSDHTTLPSPGNGTFSPFCWCWLIYGFISFCNCINTATINYIVCDYSLDYPLDQLNNLLAYLSTNWSEKTLMFNDQLNPLVRLTVAHLMMSSHTEDYCSREIYPIELLFQISATRGQTGF